jgi:WD40 repeat protein
VSLLKKKGLTLNERWRVALGDYAACVAVDGERAVVGTGEGHVVPIALATGAVLAALPAHRHGALALASSRGLVASAGHDGRVRLGTREIAARVATEEGLAFSPDGARLAIADGKRVLVVDRDGETQASFEPLASTVASLAFAPDGARLAAAAYGGVRVYDLASGSSRELAWKGSLLHVRWSPTGRVIASGTQDGAVHFWRLDEGSDSEMHGFPGKPRALAWDARGSSLATAGGELTCVWDFVKGPEGSRPIVLAGHGAPCERLAFHPSKGRLAAGTREGEVLLWTPTRGVRPELVVELGSEVTALHWIEGGVSLLACDARGDVVRFDVRD